jgi:hypothetical protein
MSVYRKLQAARAEFLSMPIKKSGKNKFANFEYFELSDFIPTVSKLFDMAGLCGVVRFTDTEATLTVYDADGDGSIVFTSPFVMAENAKGQAIQSLGSTHTYFRRYLWLLAMDIVEVDLVDAAAPAEPVKKAKPVETTKTPATVEKQTVQGKDRDWQIKIEEKGGEWQNGMVDATTILLTFAESVDSVVKIFQTNRNLYDKLKEEHADIYVNIMQLFTAAKAKFKE